MSIKTKKESKKKETIIQTIKESQTIDKKHKEIIKNFQDEKKNINSINNDIYEINEKIISMDKYRNKFTIEELKIRAGLLNNKELLEISKKNIDENFNEMDYYDKVGDLIIQYYELRDNNKTEQKESRNIMEFLGKKK